MIDENHLNEVSTEAEGEGTSVAVSTEPQAPAKAKRHAKKKPAKRPAAKAKRPTKKATKKPARKASPSSGHVYDGLLTAIAKGLRKNKDTIIYDIPKGVSGEDFQNRLNSVLFNRPPKMPKGLVLRKILCKKKRAIALLALPA